jgi:hypothetical protein
MVIEKVKKGAKSIYTEIKILFLAAKSDMIGFAGIQNDGILEFWYAGMLGLAERDLILSIFPFLSLFCLLSREERVG